MRRQRRAGPSPSLNHRPAYEVTDGAFLLPLAIPGHPPERRSGPDQFRSQWRHCMVVVSIRSLRPVLGTVEHYGRHARHKLPPPPALLPRHHVADSARGRARGTSPSGDCPRARLAGLAIPTAPSPPRSLLRACGRRIGRRSGLRCFRSTGPVGIIVLGFRLVQGSVRSSACGCGMSLDCLASARLAVANQGKQPMKPLGVSAAGRIREILEGAAGRSSTTPSSLSRALRVV